MLKLGYQEKWTLRYAIFGLLFLALSGIEGILMRFQLVEPGILDGIERVISVIRPGSPEKTAAEQFYGMLTAHPIVGIYGFVYLSLMGVFYFLVPFLLKKEIRYKKLVPFNFFLQVFAVLLCWSSGFFTYFNSLYTLYWPLPVSFDIIPAIGAAIFSTGLILIELNILIFAFNLFATVLQRSNPSPGYSYGRFLVEAFGIGRMIRFIRRDKSKPDPNYEELPVFIVAIGRGSVDTVINAIILLFAGIVILVFSVPFLVAGLSLNSAVIDPLVYKNIFWWGLDMIADGNVLMYTAGTWYLLIPLLLNRKLYGESIVRTVILVDLLVSMFVWSHHLLADQTQPLFLIIFSGQFVTWGEFITMGLTIFAVLMTVWQARPVKFSPPLKFVMGSIFGFILGGMAGLIQANYGLNVILHNTQWVIGTHAHTLLLAGLGTLIFAVIYALVPILTKVDLPNNKLVNFHLWSWLAGSLGMSYVMGFAGIEGMLRRTLYYNGEYRDFMIIALISAGLMAVSFVVFLVNLIQKLMFMNILRIFKPEMAVNLKNPAYNTGAGMSEEPAKSVN